MRRLLNILAYVLIIAGALNWGLWGFFQFDFVAWMFGGNTTWISRLLYAVIGLAGVWSLASGSCRQCCKMLCCKPGECPCGRCGSKGGSCDCCKTGDCSCCKSGNCKCDKCKKMGQ